MADQVGLKLTWMVPETTDTPQDRFDISSGLDDIVFFGMRGKSKAGVPKTAVIGIYTGADAAPTLANYNGLPVGSMIFDTYAYKWHIKTAATTWKSSAASS